MNTIQKLLDKKTTSSATIIDDSSRNSSVEREKLNKAETGDAADASTEGAVVVVDADKTQQQQQQQQQQKTLNNNQLQVNNFNPNDASSQRVSIFSKIFSRSKTKQADPKFLDDLLDDEGSKLPMVKFDSDGDFFKEQLEVKINKMENQGDNMSHIIRIGNKMEIDTKKVKKYLKKGFKFAFSQIGLACLVVGYVILGALMFMKIESEHEKENKGKITKNREEFFRKIKESAEDMFNGYLKDHFHTKYNIYRNQEIEEYNKMFMIRNLTTPRSSHEHNKGLLLMRNKKDTVMFDKKSLSQKRESERQPWHIILDKDIFFRQLRIFLDNLVKDNDKMEDKDKNKELDNEEVWNYPNALLYSATVITTIGYGNITPKSNAGKILTIFYAMIGIPLMFMCLTNTGDLLAGLFIKSYSKCVRFLYKRVFKHKLKIPYSSSKYEENKEEMLQEFAQEYDNEKQLHVPIVATLGVLTAYIFAGAVIFSVTEKWNFLDGAYFCFITFTTIGFGDFVPGKSTLATEKQGVAALCTLYLLVGMVIMAMCFKLMQDEVVLKAKWFGERLGII